MKLLTGKLDTQYDNAFRLSYALTITPAAERSTMQHGERTLSYFHKAVMTVADNTGDVVNIFEREYHARDHERTDGLSKVRVNRIRRDLSDIAKSAC